LLVSDSEGVGVAVLPLDVDVSADGEADGAGADSSSVPESDAEERSEESDVAESPGVDSVLSPLSSSTESASELSEADGDGESDVAAPSSRAATQSWYSSAVRLLEAGWSSALASVGVKPIPMSTAVGIAARAIALPAGMWNLVNSGFLGAAWRGPVLPRDLSTSVPWVTSSAGTVPPVRPVRRARS
jgi:hypothetical protein